MKQVHFGRCVSVRLADPVRDQILRLADDEGEAPSILLRRVIRLGLTALAHDRTIARS